VHLLLFELYTKTSVHPINPTMVLSDSLIRIRALSPWSCLKWNKILVKKETVNFLEEMVYCGDTEFCSISWTRSLTRTHKTSLARTLCMIYFFTIWLHKLLSLCATWRYIYEWGSIASVVTHFCTTESLVVSFPVRSS